MVAREVYGNEAHTDVLAEANPLITDAGKVLTAGTEVRVPRFIDHEVKPGDTLGELAISYLGDAARYPEIFAANRDTLTSPTAIEVGMHLKIPILK
jgi:nucleoid-associated protein YgaU